MTAEQRATNSHWWVILVVAWMLMAGLGAVRQVLPSWWWMEVPVDGVVVSDARAGTCPQMQVTREIHRPFAGRWVVTLLLRDSRGAFVQVLSTGDREDYRPGNAIPAPLDLGWWMEIPVCDFRPGVYKIRTQWVLNPESPSVRRKILNTSNKFTLHE